MSVASHIHLIGHAVVGIVVIGVVHVLAVLLLLQGASTAGQQAIRQRAGGNRGVRAQHSHYFDEQQVLPLAQPTCAAYGAGRLKPCM